LRLFDGSIFGVDERDQTSHVTSFRIYDLTVRSDVDLGMGDVDPQEMSLPVLRKTIAQAPDYSIDKPFDLYLDPGREGKI